MKHVVILLLLILPLIINTQNSLSNLSNSIVVVGIYDRTDCGLVDDLTRDFSEDNESAEAVMDKTGISELGTGFVFEDGNDKYIVTCKHVLYKSGRIVAFDLDYNTYELEIVGSDMPYDIVVLKFKQKVDGMNFKAIPFAHAFEVSQESSIQHIGFWKIDGTPNIISGHILANTIGKKSSYLMTGIGYFESSAFIPGGFSGGPVINEKGKVVGVNTARNKQGTSYALKGNIVHRLVKDIIKYGKVRRIFNGIEFSQDFANGPIVIQAVIANTPASKKYDDLIDMELIGINGQVVNSIFDVLQIMEKIRYGKSIVFELENGKKVSIKSEYLDETNLEKIVEHCLSLYCYPEFSQAEQNNDLVVVVEQGIKNIIKTAGISGNKVYCLNNLAELGIIIRMFAPYGLIELGKDDSHIYVKEIKFSKDISKRILYY